MSTFQLIVISLFVAFIIIGVGTFALFGGVFGGSRVGAVIIWGTEPRETMEFIIESMSTNDNAFEEVRYVEQDPETYRTVLVNAMASGRAPDLFMVSQEDLQSFSDKIQPIPYGVVSQSQFVSSYVDEGQLFLTPQGSLALPFRVDPLVMYWNRDLFASAGVAQAPQYWNEFLTLAPKMYSANASQNITRSVVAMGTWENVLYAKGILSTLFMQAGEYLTARDSSGKLIPIFGDAGQGENSSAESALRFYTEFANPSKSNYSWNRSLPRSDRAFVSGQLGVYFGRASEYFSIAEANPNLRYAVSMMPQLQGGSTQLTFGTLTGFSIPLGSRNASGAAVIATKLTSPKAAELLVQKTGMPSARRDSAPNTSNNAVADVFFKSALISRGWTDPNSAETDRLFKSMIESVISGSLEPAAAVNEAQQEFSRILPRI